MAVVRKLSVGALVNLIASQPISTVPRFAGALVASFRVGTVCLAVTFGNVLTPPVHDQTAHHHEGSWCGFAFVTFVHVLAGESISFVSVVAFAFEAAGSVTAFSVGTAWFVDTFILVFTFATAALNITSVTDAFVGADCI